jgi:hypothetical protein
VRDPAHKELVTASPQAVAQYMLALDGIGVGLGKGAGDCDCATIAIGGELLATGFPVRIATTADPKAPAGNMFGHVFPQALVPGLGWVTVDPVLHPNRKAFAIAPHSRIAFWDLSGRLLGYSGNVRGALGDPFINGVNEMNYQGMYGQGGLPETHWKDLSGFLGLEESNSMPQAWESVGLANWGYLSPTMGYISGDAFPMPPVEVVPDSMGIARTPMLELAPQDFKYMQVVQHPYDGMMALGDDGTVFQYDGSLGAGFFKRMFRRIKKGVKKIAKKIRKGIRFVISKMPGGKMLLKIADKIHKVAMKFVRPLMKFVGKYAAKLAPIAALIPGYGPAIAAGLRVAGKVAQVMTKFGVKLAGKKGKARTLVAKTPEAIKGMQKELAEAAAKLKAKGGGAAAQQEA